MQAQLSKNHPEHSIAILAINEAKHAIASSYKLAAEIGSLPILQDTEEVNAWGQWSVSYRDVVIVHACGAKVDVYNLSKHDLKTDENYNQLKNMILEATTNI